MRKANVVPNIEPSWAQKRKRSESISYFDKRSGTNRDGGIGQKNMKGLAPALSLWHKPKAATRGRKQEKEGPCLIILRAFGQWPCGLAGKALSLEWLGWYVLRQLMCVLAFLFPNLVKKIDFGRGASAVYSLSSPILIIDHFA